MRLIVTAAFAVLACATPAQALQCLVGTITFHESGGLKSCRIEGHHEFRTAAGRWLKCRSGDLVTQYPDGGLESCVLLEPTTFGDRRCAAAAKASFGQDGSLTACK